MVVIARDVKTIDKNEYYHVLLVLMVEQLLDRGIMQGRNGIQRLEMMKKLWKSCIFIDIDAITIIWNLHAIAND